MAVVGDRAGGFAPAGAPPAAPPAYAPVLTLAQALAHYAQLPQQQAISEGKASADAQAQAQQQTIHGYIAALAPLLARIAPAVQGGYTQAAGLDALLGKGFGNDLAAQAAPAQAQDANLLRISGGQAQAPQVNAQMPSQQLGGALGWLNGGLPAQGLNQAGAAFGAAASMLPGQVARQGQEQIGAIGARQAQTDAGYAQKAQDLAAQYPGLLLKTKGQVESQQAAQRSADSLARSREGALTGVDPVTGRPTLAANVAQAKLDLQAQQQAITQQRNAATIAYQKGELSSRQYANALTKARDANSLAVKEYNAQTSRISATASATRANAATAPKFSPSASRALGYRVDQFGNAQTGKDGQPILLPGFAVGPNGQVVKTAVGKPGGLTQQQWDTAYGKITTKLTEFRTGRAATAGSSTQPATAATPPQGYEQALEWVKATYPTISNAKATQLVDLTYKPQQTAAESFGTDKANGLTMTDSLTAFLKHYATGESPVPLPVALLQAARTFGLPLEAVKAAAAQIAQQTGL